MSAGGFLSNYGTACRAFAFFRRNLLKWLIQISGKAQVSSSLFTCTDTFDEQKLITNAQQR